MTKDENTDDDEVEFIALTRDQVLGEHGDLIRESLAVADVVTGGDGPGVTERARLARDVAAGEANNPAEVTGGLVSWSSSRSGRNADGAIDRLGRLGVDNLVIDKISVLGRTHDKIADRVEQAVDAGVSVHVVATGTEITAENVDVVLAVLGGLDTAGVELERETQVRDVHKWLDETTARGRPPIGFKNENGERVPAENYDEVRAVISMFRHGEISKRKAADRLDTSPRTVGRAADNPERYGLRPSDWDPETEIGREPPQ